MTYCCVTAHGLLQNQGGRGFSLVVGVVHKKPRFVMQARSHATASDAVSEVTPGAFVAQSVVGYCPGCGVELEDFYAASLEMFVHQELVLNDLD